MSGDVWAFCLVAVWAVVGCAAILQLGPKRRESRSVAAHRRALDTLESVVHHGVASTLPTTPGISHTDPAVGPVGVSAPAGSNAVRPRTAASAPRLARSEEPRQIVKALIPELRARAGQAAGNGRTHQRRPLRRRRSVFAPSHVHHWALAAGLTVALVTVAVAVGLAVSGTVGGSRGRGPPSHAAGKLVPPLHRLSAAAPEPTPPLTSPPMRVLASGPGGVDLVVPSGSRVVFEARGRCWLDVASGGPNTLFEGILQPGAIEGFTLVTTLQTRVGDASEVQVLVGARTVSLPAVGPNPLDIEFATSGAPSTPATGT